MIAENYDYMMYVCGSEWSPAEVCAAPTATQRRRRYGVAPPMDVPSATRVVSITSYTEYVRLATWLHTLVFPTCELSG